MSAAPAQGGLFFLHKHLPWIPDRSAWSRCCCGPACWRGPKCHGKHGKNTGQRDDADYEETPFPWRRLLPHRELSSSPRSVFDQAVCRLSSGKAPLIRSPFSGHISAASDKAAPGSGSFSVFLLKRSASCPLQRLPE